MSVSVQTLALSARRVPPHAVPTARFDTGDQARRVATVRGV